MNKGTSVNYVFTQLLIYRIKDFVPYRMCKIHEFGNQYFREENFVYCNLEISVIK